MKKEKITIIGCGLIGGSIALALRHKRAHSSLACLDLPERLPAIREAGIPCEAGTLEDLGTHIPDSSLVLLATPVQKIPEMIARLRSFVRPGLIISDVGSTKKHIMTRARELLPPDVHFVGGHPLAGSELSGVEAADALLFSDRVYLLCPYPHTPPDSLLKLMDLAEDLLALPLTMDPEEHDRMMALVSHLPQIISVALMHAAHAGDASHAMLDKLSGRGFLDMTRLAASSFGIWQGILETNREAIEESLDRFEGSLSLLRQALSKGDAGGIWEETGRLRRKLGPESSSRPRKPDLRGSIDRYDKQILAALGHRMHAVRRMGRLKASRSMSVIDPDRERRMMRQREEWRDSLGLPPGLIEEIFEVILRHSSRIQSETLGQER
jgi:prephenate dehydrogenase